MDFLRRLWHKKNRIRPGSLISLSPRQKSVLTWTIISLSIALFVSPYLFPGVTNSKLGGYLAFSALPIILGALLRARQGAIVSWLCVSLAMLIDDLLVGGFSTLQARSDFIGIIAILLFALAAGQYRHISLKLTESHRALQRQATTDGLTGLPNHRAVVERLEIELERTHRFERPLSVLFFDGDRFKQINDTYGHAVGDVVLCQLGTRAESILREGDTVGRFGGEEFVVLLPETDNEQALIVAERIRTAVAASPMASTHVAQEIIVTISMGVATYPGDGRESKDLLNKADQAMYWAKRLGRNQVRNAQNAEQASQEEMLLAFSAESERRESSFMKQVPLSWP